MDTVIRNAQIISPFEIRRGCVLIRDKKIAEVGERVNAPAHAQMIDAEQKYLSPGFIDLHVHGGGGFSAMSGRAEDVIGMCNAHLSYGTTSLLPTTLAAPMEKIERAVQGIQEAASGLEGACIAGVHLEGPCLSPRQSGAQSPQDLKKPSETNMERLLNAWPEGVKIMGVAPELDGALELGDLLGRRGIVASVAHSDATYAQVRAAIEHGYSDVTHLYSGCSGMIRVNSYRIPGVIEAGLNLDALTAQVIADGKHLPYELLQLIYRCKGPDGMYLITDGLEYAAAELKEGVCYRQLNGMETVYEDGVMKMMDRQSFAGSVATMSRLVRVICEAGIPLANAVRMATDTPARRIGLANKGRVEPGMDADIVLFDDQINVSLVIKDGQTVMGDGKIPAAKALTPPRRP